MPSAASDPLDDAFPDDAPATAQVTGDPLDHAFPDEKPKKDGPPSALTRSLLARRAGTVDNPITGIAENLWSGVTSGAGYLADALTISDPGTHKWGYQPRTQSGQGLQADVSDLAKHAGNTIYNELGAPVVAGMGGDVEAARETLGMYTPEALGATGTVAGLGGLADSAVSGLKPRPGAALAKQTETQTRAQAAADSAVSAQAQGAAPVPIDVTKLTPETQAELARMHAAGQTPDAAALHRIYEAETLPKGDAGPVRLTQAEARGDIQAKAEEFNNKGQNPQIGQRKAQNDTAMHSSLDEMRRESSPTSVANSAEQNSQVLIDKLKGIGDKRDADITEAYNQAKAIAGNKLPMEAGDYVARAHAALDEGNAGDFLPADVRNSVLTKFEKNGGNMTLDDFLSARKTLGNAQRELEAANKPNALHAVNVLRDQLEATQPKAGTGADALAAYNKASALAKANFDDIKTNPAYKAAYNDRAITPTGEVSDLNKNFGQRFVTGGTQANLQRLRTMFAGDDEANRTMTGITLDRLKDASGGGKGEFLAKAYNQRYAKEVAPRARELLGGDQQLQDHLEQLGRVAENIKARDASDFSNFSHTNVAQRAAGAAVNFGRGFLPQHINKGIDVLTEKNRVADILKPGAGL